MSRRSRRIFLAVLVAVLATNHATSAATIVLSIDGTIGKFTISPSPAGKSLL